jgi:hypothetical protein
MAGAERLSCAVAMTASAKLSRRVGAPDLGAAAVLTTGLGGPVFDGVADKTISPG